MKPAQVIVLCEDKQQEVFVRRFMKPRTNHPIRVVSAPVGEGAGEQFVREQYPQQLRASRAATVNVVLVVMIDGDTAGSVQRMRQLDESCRLSGIAPRTDADRVIVLVPERNIETWLAYLGGATVEETTDYPRLDRPSDCKTHVRVLTDMCDRSQLRQPAPQSLAAPGTAGCRVAGAAEHSC